MNFLLPCQFMHRKKDIFFSKSTQYVCHQIKLKNKMFFTIKATYHFPWTVKAFFSLPLKNPPKLSCRRRRLVACCWQLSTNSEKILERWGGSLKSPVVWWWCLTGSKFMRDACLLLVRVLHYPTYFGKTHWKNMTILLRDEHTFFTWRSRWKWCQDDEWKYGNHWGFLKNII